MFGSLVIVLPSVHSGGALHLRHGGRQVIHDCSDKFNEPPYDSVSWIAFYSDVEHEVAMVESGYRVTLTYNLYFADMPTLDPATVAEDLTSNILYKTFADLLAEPSFLPDGGLVGFGLQYDYPINPGRTKLSDLGRVLKGEDAILFRVAELFKLEPVFKVVYTTRRGGTYLCDGLFKDTNEVQDLGETLRRDYGGKLISGASYEIGFRGIDFEVHWVGDGSKNTEVKTYYVAYGNEASLGELYGRVNLVVTIGKKDFRNVQ